MKKPIDVAFDQSNGAFYIWVAMITDYDNKRDDVNVTRCDHQAFTSYGAAMAFYAPWASPKGWYKEKVRGSDIEVMDLKPENPWNAYRLELHQLLLMEK